MTEPRIALITGSGKKRIGWHVARALGQKGAGVILHYNSSRVEAEASVSELRDLGISARALQADLGKEDEVKGLFKQIHDEEGRLDVLVTCASIWQSKRLEETTGHDLMKNFQINTLGTFLCAQHAGLMMVKQPEGGCIITVGDWAIARPYPDHVAYFISKGCIPTMTRCLAVELAMRNPNVRVNCLEPGPVMLPDDMPDSVREKVIEGTLVKREGSPENIAKAVIGLVENDFITGACLPVDGGRSIYAGES